MLNGSFLASRGAIFPALKLSGLSDQEARRSWAAFRSGQWSMSRLLNAWREHVSSRVAGHRRQCPAPSERSVQLSPHSAQAAQSPLAGTGCPDGQTLAIGTCSLLPLQVEGAHVVKQRSSAFLPKEV